MSVPTPGIISTEEAEKRMKSLTLPQEGKRLKLRIAKMVPDKLGNMIPADKMQKGSKPTADVIVLFTSDDEKIGFLTLPTKGRVYTSSNMYKFIKHYGGPPKIGMEVELEEDERGFRKLMM